MRLREWLKGSRTLVGLVKDARAIRKAWSGRHAKYDIAQYLSKANPRKLAIGSGPTILEGWLNTDFCPASKAVVYLDATKPFAIPAAVFDYVYSEHMIEHVSWKQGALMLRECARILKKGGKIRLVTPDLRVILALYSQDIDALQQGYIQWATDRFIPWAPSPKASLVINNLFRDWGHQFLYDAELLTISMREAGFENIRQYGYGESDDNELRGIERHGSNVGSEQLAAFECLILEGTRG